MYSYLLFGRIPCLNLQSTCLQDTDLGYIYGRIPCLNLQSTCLQDTDLGYIFMDESFV